MINYILFPLLELRGFVVTGLAALVVLTLLLFAIAKRKKQGLADFRLQKLLLGRTRRETFGMAVSISQLLFIVSMVVLLVPFNRVQIMALGSLCVLAGIASKSVTAFFSECLYGVMAGICLLAGNLLIDYLKDMGPDWYIIAVLALLYLFLLQYAVYHLIKSTEGMLNRHGSRINRRRAAQPKA